MNDETRLAIDDAETPVNPYSLLAAVNASSRSANVAWLIFLGLMAYLLIALASVTHRDLLLAGDIALPLLQVKLGLVRFFIAVPILLVIVHAGLLGKLALLARKTLEFDAALRMLESTDERSHPLRLELDGFFIVQAIAGPERSRVVSAFLNGLSWFTLVVCPVALLLYVQISFLPFHDPAITLVHCVAVFADIVLLLLLGVFLMRPEISYFGAFWRLALHNPGSFAFGVAVLALAAFASAFAAVPGQGDRNDGSGPFTSADGALFGFFPRNLTVTDAGPLSGTDGMSGARGMNLRGRDLRSARLDRSDLHQADLTGANLDRASFAGADLRGIRLGCEERTDLRASENRQADVCASARGANFARARLDGAEMPGVDLRGARFGAARLDGANLSKAQMTGADFSRAELKRANVSGGAALQGASFEFANLQGADFTGAKLQMTDFSGAAMQGAMLARANLEGASMRDAVLDGASLQMAKLFGTDMRGARLRLADLSGTFVWQTQPPASESIAGADMANMIVNPPSQEDMTRMRSIVENLEGAPDKVRLAGLSTPLNDAGSNATWPGSPAGQAWVDLAKASGAGTGEGYRTRITEQLARLACSPRFSDGAVAAGVARRAADTGFKGDPAALLERLRSVDCRAAATVPPAILRDLAAAADAAPAAIAPVPAPEPASPVAR